MGGEWVTRKAAREEGEGLAQAMVRDERRRDVNRWPFDGVWREERRGGGAGRPATRRREVARRDAARGGKAGRGGVGWGWTGLVQPYRIEVMHGRHVACRLASKGDGGDGMEPLG